VIVWYRSNFLLLAAAAQTIVLALPGLANAQDCAPLEIELTSQLEVDQFQSNHGPCERVLQNLIIRGDDIVTLDGLSDLSAVLGDMKIENNPSLEMLDGLANLQSAGSLSIQFNSSLLKIDGLSSLTTVERSLLLRFNYRLQSVNGLTELTYVGESLNVISNFEMTSLAGFKKLNQVGGDLVLSANSFIDSNGSLLDGFSNLTSVGGLFIGFNNLTNLDGLSSLTDVTGKVAISGTGLVSIDGLSALTHVGGDLFLLQNSSLSRCMGITRLVDQIDDAEPGPGVGHVPDVGGKILFVENANGCNSVEEILAEVPLLEMNAGLNDAWFNPETDGQGFFFIVFPEIKQMFMAWFTYDTERPPEDVTALLGEPGHRWLTAQGGYEENVALLDISVTVGGVFDSAQPTPITEQDGEIMVEFNTCNSGTVSYDIPSIDRQGVVPIERIVLDNVSTCYLLGKQAVAVSPLESN
jgi:hypothetical protein